MADLNNLTDDDYLALDEAVHDVASQIASNVNNAGQQVDYLLSNGWTVKDIEEWLEGR